MKRKVWMIFAVLSVHLMLAGVPAFAQSIRLKAKIPFPFTATNAEFGPGEYTAQLILNGTALQIRGVDGGKVATMFPIAARVTAVHKKGQLVFNRYGDQYFLSKVWWPDYDVGCELQKSAHESELARNVENHPGTVTVGRR